ncbi:MAG: hypothetical protein AAF403_08030 [Pseudomonadota bacterium]
MLMLTTKNNPKNVERFIKHYQKTEAKLPVFLLCNHDDASLDGLKIPDHFHLCKLEVEDPSVNKINDAFIKQFPCAPWYGFLTDKAIPRTKHWDRLILKALKRYPFVHCKDHYTDNEHCNIFFIRGDLMRAHGDYLPCPLRHYYLDCYWYWMTTWLGIRAYIENVTIEYSQEDRHLKHTQEWADRAKIELDIYVDYLNSKKWHASWYRIQSALSLKASIPPNIDIDKATASPVAHS